MKNHVRDFRSSERSLSILLWVLGLTVFLLIPVLAMGEPPKWERIALAAFYTALVLSGVTSAWSHQRSRRLLMVAAAAPLALLWFEFIDHAPFFTLLASGVRLGMVGVFAAVLLLRVLAPGRVSGARLKGAIAVYVLIGVMFAEGYRVLLVIWPGSLSIHSTDPLSVKFTAELLYFSFSTLTTAGYGDIVPLHALTRSLSNFEAITGQMYIVLLIGRLLTLHLAQEEGFEDLDARDPRDTLPRPQHPKG